MAVTSPGPEANMQHCLTVNRSESYADAWSSLFSSFSDQHIPLQTPDQTQSSTLSLDADHRMAVTPAAAVHQSAVFAALFEDMIASQSCDALMHVQQSQASSNHSSAVSLCDSAASFSFKTAMRNQAATEPALASGTLQTHLLDQQPIAVGSHNADKANLSVTLKDWQVETNLQPEFTYVDALVQPIVQRKADARSGTNRFSQHSYSSWQATKGMHSAQQAAVTAAPTSDVQAAPVPHGTEHAQSLSVSHVIKCSPTSKRVKGRSDAAQRKGTHHSLVVQPIFLLPSLRQLLQDRPMVRPLGGCRCCFGWLSFCCTQLHLVLSAISNPCTYMSDDV